MQGGKKKEEKIYNPNLSNVSKSLKPHQPVLVEVVSAFFQEQILNKFYHLENGPTLEFNKL